MRQKVEKLNGKVYLKQLPLRHALNLNPLKAALKMLYCPDKYRTAFKSGLLVGLLLPDQTIIVVMQQLGALHGEHVVDTGNVKGDLHGVFFRDELQVI